MNIVTKKRIIIASLLVLAGLLFNFFYNNSYVQITFPSEFTGTVKIYRNDSPAIEINVESSNQVKRLLPRGTYSTLSTSEQGSFLAVVESPGFLRTGQVSASLENQKKVTFVGSNPDACAFYDSSAFLTAPCTGRIDTLQNHVAATKTTPAYKQPLPTPVEGFIEGDYYDASGDLRLVIKERGEPGIHIAYSLNASGLSNPTVLESLDADTVYRVSQRPDGNVFVSSIETGEAQILSNTGELVEERFLPSSIDGNTLSAIASTGSDIAAYYSNQEGVLTSDFETTLEFFEDGPQGRSQGELHINPDKNLNKPGITTFDTVVTGLSFCGEGMVCLLSDNDLYRINATSGEKDQLITEVSTFEAVNNIVYISKDQSILRYDLLENSGYSIHDFQGSYRSCGTKYTQKGLITCSTNDQNYTDALLVDLNESDDGLVESVINLREDPGISNVQVSRNILYISPVLGEQVFDEETGFLDYPEEDRLAGVAYVNAVVASEGIIEKGYTVINPFEY